ncbi:MAG: chitobiase/beta-hexosaminidase C-terminal domain-containing protein [Paramuribaculum sp.]|nr:chitobiase/beta-hexosaminidase C-terminal domain-containing protein [Paramuribaculum sp.]
MSLLLFAPNISALDEEVYLGFFIPDGNNIANILASEAGVYSKREGDAAPLRTRYDARFVYGSRQTDKTETEAVFPPNVSSGSYGSVSKFMVMGKDGIGFNVEFDPELRTVTTSGSNQASLGYALTFSNSANANNPNLQWNGLCLMTTTYPYYPRVKISSTNQWRPIKKVKFGRTRPQYTNESYSLSYFNGTEKMDDIFSRVDEAGTWEFDATDNCWTYVLAVPVQEVTFTVANGFIKSTALHLNKLGIVWDAPIDAPTINMSAAPSDGILTETGVNTYSYNYYNTPAVLKCFKQPAGTVKMIYVTDDNVPESNWRDYDPSVGVVLPENAVWNQETPVYIAGVDKDGNVGMKLTVNCKREQPAAPPRPQVLRYAKSFEYTTLTDASLRLRSIPKTGWISLDNQNQYNLSVEVDVNALVLDLKDAYSTALDKVGGQIDPDIMPVGGLEYAITNSMTPPDETFEINQQFKPATVNEGCTAPEYNDPENNPDGYFGPQYGWFVYGTDINGKAGPNSGGLNISGGDRYLHLRAYTQVGDDKFYSDIVTIAITRTPLAGPTLSKPKDENYTWTNGAIPRMSYAKEAMIQITLPEDTPEGTKIRYAYEGSDEPGLEPSLSANKSFLTESTFDGTTEHISDWTYAPGKSCIITLGSNGLGTNGTTPFAGRLFVQSVNSSTGQESSWSIVDVEPIITTDYYLDGYLAPANGYDQNGLVALYGAYANPGLRVVGVYDTDAALENGKNTYYVYLEDCYNNAIKLIINSATEPAVFDTYRSKTPGKDCIINDGEIIGRVAYRSFVDGKGLMPEILITPTKEESFINYLPEAHEGGFYGNAILNFCPDSTKVTEAAFNKKVRMRGLEKVAGSSRLRGIDGTEYTIFTRLKLPNEKEVEDAISALEDGNVYALTCYVGQASNSLALLPCEVPIECPDTPEIFAPNPITDGELDAISAELNITIGNIRQHGMTYYWSDLENINTFNDAQLENAIGVGLKKIDLVKGVPTFTLKKADYKLDKNNNRQCHLWVYARSEEGLWSIEPATIEIEWHELDAENGVVNSIAQFKEMYLNEKNLPESISENQSRASFDGNHYHQFSNQSKAIVIEATEEWLYIRDLEPTDKDGKFHSANYILVHNENKWVNPPVPVAGEPDSVRMLRQGDIINNFALIPALSRRGNLISECTGFARTVHFIDSIYSTNPDFQLALRPINVGYSDESVKPDPDNDDYSGYYKNIVLGENQRMRYLDIKNVKIEKKDNEYFLVLGEGNIALAFDIFEECYNGWDNFYEPDEPDELYNIKGIFLKNEKDRDESYAIAMIDFSTNKGQVSAPKLYCTEATNKDTELQYFVNNLEVNIEPEDGASVFYSINGADPKNMDSSNANRLSFTGETFSPTLPANSDRITVKAYAYKPGYKPSATVSRIFVRNSTELQYIFQFLDQAREGRYYKLSTNLKVIATGGKYMFLAGPMGYFLPVFNNDGWDDTELAAGRYVRDFTVGYMEDTHSNRIAVATGHLSTFDKITSPLWEDDKMTPEADQFHAAPDTLNSLSLLNARRLVTLMNVTLTDGKVQTNDGEDLWYIQDRQTGQNHPMYVGRLGKVSAASYSSDGTRVPEELRDGSAYNITGFVMLGDPTGREGEVEFWPIQADRVTRSPRPTADFTNTLSNQVNSTNGDYMVNFNGTTTVTLKSTRPNTTIYYMIDSHSEDNSTATWYTYQHPILIDKSDVIRVKCQEPAFAESATIVITLNKIDRAGDVSFNVTSEYGKTTVRLTTDEPNATIYYGINNSACPNRYSTRLTFTQGAKLYACVQVSGKPRGAVSMLQVMVVGGTSSTVSGRVQFELDEGSNGAKLVKISPVDNLSQGSYTIYYTTKLGVPFSVDTWNRYDNPFELTESSAVLAVLMENDKPVGEVAETYVFVGAVTGIDGIDSDSRDDNEVRVEGGNIIAPEGSQVFDINGRRVNAEGLRRGIYIVRIPGGKGIKVKVL